MARDNGAMNVYSIVPSQRSQATVSIRKPKRTPRYAHTTAPMSRYVMYWFTSNSTPLDSARLHGLRDEDDRQRVGHGPDEPGDVPPDVALGQVGVPLDDTAGADELGAHHSPHGFHANTSLSSSSSSSASNSRPVAAKNA